MNKASIIGDSQWITEQKCYENNEIVFSSVQQWNKFQENNTLALKTDLPERHFERIK